MTTRPGGAALALLSGHRHKRLSHLIHVIRTDGAHRFWTDHDRAMTDPNVSGESAIYVPRIFAGSGEERRKAEIESPEHKAIGVIDGNVMTIPDLIGQRYRGASIEIRVVDWSRPWRVFATFTKTIRKVDWDGLRFVAMLSGPTAPLERRTGGRFGGVAGRECGYVLGGVDCKQDVAPWRVVGARVGVINQVRSDVEFTVTSFPTAQVDEWYRYGEVRWLWGPPVVTGTTTGTTTTTTLTASGSPGWTVDFYVGQTVRVLSAIAGPVIGWAKITANTASTISYLDENANMSGHGPASDFDIAPDSANLGVVTEIGRYTAATRRSEMFVPTPFDLVLNDSGIVEVGCDGLFSTCKTKFANQDNFGGNHLQPRGGDQWEVS